MKARVKLVDGMMFVGESGSGHAVVMDGAPEYGGRNLGIRPMEMLLIGLGGCTDCDVEVTAERADTDPKVFTAIHITYRVKGRDLAPAKVERAIELSKEKYCSASIMLGAVAKITHSWTAVDETAELEASPS
jgi:putative redox protein